MHDRAIWNNFERLYIDYQPRLIAYALRFVGDSVEAQDLVQDCFVRLWDDYAELEEDEAPMLLFTMMRHRCLTFLFSAVSRGTRFRPFPSHFFPSHRNHHHSLHGVRSAAEGR